MNEDGTLGEDKGNMSIDVDTLTITDQKNKEESWSESFSFSTSMGGNFDQAGKAGLAPGNGSTAVGANNSGSKTEGIAYGVLGKTKSLKVAGEDVADDSEILAGKHRDISETSVVTKEETTGGLNVDVTISNAYLGKDGLKNLKNDLSLVDDLVYTKEAGLGGNTKQAAENVGKAGVNLGKAVGTNLIGKGKDGILEDYRSNIRNQELGLQTRMDSDLKEAIDNMAENPEQAEAQLEKVAQMAAAANGVEGEVDIEFFNDPTLEAGGHKDGKIYINLAHQDGTSGTLMESLGDELSHYVDFKKGRANSLVDTSRGDISTVYGNDARSQALGYSKETATVEDFNDFQQTVSQHDFSETNDVVANTEDMEHRLTTQIHEVALGQYHSSIKFKPENQELYEDNDDFQIDSTDGKRYITLGAGPEDFNKLTGDLARPKDMDVTNKVLESLPLVPVSQEDAKFEELVQLNNNYNQNRVEYDLLPNKNRVKGPGRAAVNSPGDSYNSNSYVSGILSAGDLPVPNFTEHLSLPGYDKPLPEVLFNPRDNQVERSMQ